jgi:hypothetical protein
MAFTILILNEMNLFLKRTGQFQNDLVIQVRAKVAERSLEIISVVFNML